MVVDRADALVSRGENAIVIFTQGAHLYRDNDGSGASGNWRISANRVVDKVVIYLRDPESVLREATVYVGMFDGIEGSVSPNRYVVRFTNLRLVGTTANNWREFAAAGTNPIRYVIGSHSGDQEG